MSVADQQRNWTWAQIDVSELLHKVIIIMSKGLSPNSRSSCLLTMCRSLPIKGIEPGASVINAAVYLLNWATLKLPSVGQKLWAGGLKLGHFSSVCPRLLFFLKFGSFRSIWNLKGFWAFLMSKNILFINFRDQKRPGKQSISIIYFTRKSTI